jgi:hypothetical protein
MVHPALDRLIGNYNSANKSSTLRKLSVNRVLDDFGRKTIAPIANFAHPEW